MKKTLLSLLIGSSLLFTAPVKAASVSANIAGAWAATNLLSAGAYVNSITFVNSTLVPVTASVIDSPNSYFTWTNAAYVVQTLAASNTVITWVDILGKTNSYTNSVISPISGGVTNAAAPHNYRALVTLSIPASTTVTYTPTVRVPALLGVAVTNGAATNLLVTVDYNYLSP